MAVTVFITCKAEPVVKDQNNSENELPNIVIIYADDLGYGDVSSYGSTALITKNFDRIANEGLKFTNGYASSPTCTPSRYALLSGTYPFRRKNAKVLPGNAPLLFELGKQTLPSMLHDAGYYTGIVGKWHLGMDWSSNDGEKLQKIGNNLDLKAPIKNGPNAVGFDYYFGISASLNMDPHAYIENTKMLGDLILVETSGEVKDMLGSGGKAGWVDKNFKRDKVMQTFTNKAIDWMKEAIESDHPLSAKLPLASVVDGWEKGEDRIFRDAPLVLMTYSPEVGSLPSESCVIAMTFFDLIAASLSLGACWVGFFMVAAAQHPPIRRTLGIPTDHMLFGAMIVGYSKFEYQRIPDRNQPQVVWL